VIELAEYQMQAKGEPVLLETVIEPLKLPVQFGLDAVYSMLHVSFDKAGAMKKESICGQ
jgi:hypothetical protein